MKARIENFPKKDPNPVISIENDGSIQYSNEAGKLLLIEWGVKVGEKLPSYIEDLIQTVIAKNSSKKIEVKPEKRVYLLSFPHLPEEQCVNIYGLDISDYKDLEEKLQENREALKESEEILHLAQQVAKIGTFEWNIQTGVNIWTPELEAMYGLQPGEFGKTQSAWEQLVHPDDRFKAINLVEQALQNGEPIEGEWRVVWPDSSVHWLLGRWQVFKDKAGQPKKMTGVNIDITERKQAEEALKELNEILEEKVSERTTELENAYHLLKESEDRLSEAQVMAHIGNWDWNISTNEIYCSNELYSIFGCQPLGTKTVRGDFLNCYAYPEDKSYLETLIQKALNGVPCKIDFRFRRADGEQRYAHVETDVIFDEKNNPIRMKGILQDITERKKTEESIELLETARKKEIHHRIKNNLQVISSLLDLQAEKIRSKNNITKSEFLEAFKESQDRVMSIALIHEELHRSEDTDILNFTHYIEGLVDHLILTYELGNKDIKLSKEIEENVFFDFDMSIPLGLILNELISNSFKYAFTNKDDGEIRVTLRKNSSEISDIENKNTEYLLSVSDNGVGIPEDLDIENLDSLGLQLVITLVDQLDGKLDIKRDNGTELAIKFTVPEKNIVAESSKKQLAEDI